METEQICSWGSELIGDGPEFKLFSVSSQSNSSSDSDYDAYNSAHPYDEGHSPQSKKWKRRLILTDQDGNATVTCHWCRQRTARPHVQCSLCTIKFCPPCLLNRNGEKIRDEMQRNVRWVCPRCRGGCGPGCVNCCNCGPCRRTQRLPPTGQLVQTARSEGFSNVHDYLVNLKTGESPRAIARRKDGRGWTKVTGAIIDSSLIEVVQIPPWARTTKRSARKRQGVCINSKWRNWSLTELGKGKDVRLSVNGGISQGALPWLESEERESRTDLEKESCLQGTLVQVETEGIQGGWVDDITAYYNDMFLTNTRDRLESSAIHEKRVDAPRMSVGVGTECQPMRASIRKKKRSKRKISVRNEAKKNQVPHVDREDCRRASFTSESGEQNHGMVNSCMDDSEETRKQMKFSSLTSLLQITETSTSPSSEQGLEMTPICHNSVRQLPVSTNAAQVTSSVELQETCANLSDHETASCMDSSNTFRRDLDLIVQRRFSSEQLKRMWDHILFHRPVLNPGCMQYRLVDEEEELLYLDRHPDLAEKLARTRSSEERLKLLRGFFFWLQHSRMEGAFRPWVSEKSEDDPTERNHCTPISIPDCQVIDGLLAIEDDEYGNG